MVDARRPRPDAGHPHALYAAATLADRPTDEQTILRCLAIVLADMLTCYGAAITLEALADACNLVAQERDQDARATGSYAALACHIDGAATVAKEKAL